ncbi:DNA-binding protein [Paraburkholderia phenoliruptrix]|uniref:DNA-binding protein n=1 Tax=Paraburkholderia phenoliruptrix TaxID=252970 RepID=UPI001C6F080B|nr:DNA-binding protein [Paraburkholderia phenoliruptrix]MBW9102936.1 DNA-binding protein [Paraburkholderia phenoliruptrix]MBW9132910.1 DNA-binding protein [Paraburkholderia ginsengiterrae]
MIDTEQKLFRTPQDALIFAFNYSMQRADRSLVDRMASPAARTGKGLSGNDGAGQAGMIRRELEQLSDIERAVLVARFAPRSWPCACGRACCSGYEPNPEYQAAISLLTQSAMSVLAGRVVHYQLRRGLVEKAAGLKVEIATLARKCEVNEKTADAHWQIIKLWFQGRSRPKVKPSKRKRAAAGDATADVADEPHLHDEAIVQPEVSSAVDGLESKARKRADELLSTLPFIGT